MLRGNVSHDDPGGRVAILNPYDGMLFDRPRLAELFGFEYVLEQFKPKAQRVYGYFARPILVGDRFAGLLDAERKATGQAPSRLCWGDQPTLADCCLVPQIFNAQRFHVGALKYLTGNRVFLGDLQGGFGEVSRRTYIAREVAQRSRERDALANRLALAQGVFG